MDLAVLSMGAELSAAEQATLLAAYLQRTATDEDCRRFAALQVLAWLRETMWGVVAEVSGASALSAEEASAYADKNYKGLVEARAAFERTAAPAESKAGAA